MKSLDFFVVDAFTDKIFHGNPAAVVLLDSWLQEEIMQNIASENNLSETAFVIPSLESPSMIRWFTPSTEVELCGHATLASAFVILEFVFKTASEVHFESAGGRLTVRREEGRLYLNFPALKTDPSPSLQQSLSNSLGVKGNIQVFSSLYDVMVVLEDEEAVANVDPNFIELAELSTRGTIVTAASRDVDFVSRFFAPGVGIDEDPVTGSAHCVLIPY